MLYKENVISALNDMADERQQIDAWVHGKCFLGWIDELMCQVFDDTGLSEMLDAGNAEDEMSSEAVDILLELRRYLEFHKLWKLPAEKLVVSEQMQQVRRLAKAAIQAL